MAKQKSVFLEVDSKIIEDNLLLKSDKNEAGDFESLLGFNQKSNAEPFKFVTPTPGMVIKTFDAKGNKIFINLCKVDEIPEPKEKTESELLSLLESDDITDYRVPLSMLDPHDELDKSGKPAVVYDVAINTRFFEKIKDNQVFRDFVLEVIQQGLENKYDIELQKGGYVILRNRSSIGDLKPHRIRSITGPYKPPKRLIEEISPSEVEPRKHINFRLSRKDDMLLGEFHLPTIMTSRDVRVDVGEDRLIVQTKNSTYAEELFLPCIVKQNESVSYFNTQSKVLRVLMPC